MTDVVFLTAAGESVGSGHATRCFFVAERLHERGYEVDFRLDDPSLLPSLGFDPSFEVNERTGRKHDVAVLRDTRPDEVIVDVLTRDLSYFRELSRHCTIVQIEDRGGSFVADVVVSGYCQDPSTYRSVDGDTRFCLGTDYLVLPSYIQSLPRRETCDGADDLLVTFGSVDTSNKTGSVVRALAGSSDVTAHVVVPRHTEHEYPAAENVKTYPYGTAYRELLTEVDIALTAGGNTAYEVAALGIPGGILAEKSKQQRNAELMANRGIAVELGLFEELEPVELGRRIKSFLGDEGRLETVTERCLERIDFDGVNRVVDAVV
jgi:spore coat polysaccharide biosynthesis predicted glycosyltransferase SpsG